MNNTKIIGLVSVIAIVLSIVAIGTSLRTYQQVNPISTTQPTWTPTTTTTTQPTTTPNINEPLITNATFENNTISLTISHMEYLGTVEAIEISHNGHNIWGTSTSWNNKINIFFANEHGYNLAYNWTSGLTYGITVFTTIQALTYITTAP